MSDWFVGSGRPDTRVNIKVATCAPGSEAGAYASLASMLARECPDRVGPVQGGAYYTDNPIALEMLYKLCHIGPDHPVRQSVIDHPGAMLVVVMTEVPKLPIQ